MRNIYHRVVGIVEFKGRTISILKRDNGNYYAFVDSIQTQSALTAEEMIRYLLNSMNEK